MVLSGMSDDILSASFVDRDILAEGLALMPP